MIRQASLCASARKSEKAADQSLYRLTDLLTGRPETRETRRKTGDARGAVHLVNGGRGGTSEMRKTYVVLLITQR